MNVTELPIDFLNFTEKMKSIEKQQKSILEKKNDLQSIPIHPILSNKYVLPCCASDGSYIVFWKYSKFDQDSQQYLSKEIYFCSVAVSLVEQTYRPDPLEFKYETTLTEFEEYPLIIDLTVFDKDELHTYSLKRILEIFMSICEKRILYRYAETHSKSLIIVDGSLFQPNDQRNVSIRRDLVSKDEFNKIKKAITLINSSNPNELDSWFKDFPQIESICKQHQHMFVGVSKDSHIVDKDKFEYLKLFNIALTIQQKRENACYILFSDLSDTKQNIKQNYIILFAHLDKNAPISHRIDYLDTIYTLDDVISLLSIYSKYNRIIGTPVTPQLCHNNVVKIRQLHNFRKNEVFHMLIQANFSQSEIFYGETDVNGSLINIKSYHDKLDQLI